MGTAGTGTIEVCVGTASRRPLLVLVTLLVLAFCSVDSTVDLLVMLMAGVTLGNVRYFIDRLVGLLRVLLGVGLRLLLQFAEIAHAILLPLTGSACRLAASAAHLPLWR